MNSSSAAVGHMVDEQLLLDIGGQLVWHFASVGLVDDDDWNRDNFSSVPLLNDTYVVLVKDMNVRVSVVHKQLVVAVWADIASVVMM